MISSSGSGLNLCFHALVRVGATYRPTMNGWGLSTESSSRCKQRAPFFPPAGAPIPCGTTKVRGAAETCALTGFGNVVRGATSTSRCPKSCSRTANVLEFKVSLAKLRRRIWFVSTKTQKSGTHHVFSLHGPQRLRPQRSRLRSLVTPLFTYGSPSLLLVSPLEGFSAWNLGLPLQSPPQPGNVQTAAFSLPSSRPQSPHSHLPPTT